MPLSRLASTSLMLPALYKRTSAYSNLTVKLGSGQDSGTGDRAIHMNIQMLIKPAQLFVVVVECYACIFREVGDMHQGQTAAFLVHFEDTDLFPHCFKSYAVCQNKHPAAKVTCTAAHWFLLAKAKLNKL